MSRSTLSERAQRLNSAFHLLADGRSLNEAAEAMAEQHRISRRQAYRYLQEARHTSSPVAVAERPSPSRSKFLQTLRSRCERTRTPMT
jgi:predicted DNA-binding transcriptional regulator YafY